MTLLASTQPLDTAYDVALLDLDGVVYIGHSPVPGAAEAIGKARAAGMRTAFVTNNASRTPAAVAERLTRFGAPATASDVVTSSQAAARLVADRVPAGSPVLAVGDTGLRVALAEAGLRPVTVAAEQPVAVVQGYSPRIGYDQLAEASLAVARGALFVASNADATVPSPLGPKPGNGAFLQVVTHSTGQGPIVAGKPETPLHDEAVLRTGAQRPLVAGDRLDTDIEGANRRGAASLAVLTGVTAPADLVRAPCRLRPTYIAEDLGGLNTTHPAPRIDAAAASCGGWTVAPGPDGWWEVRGSGSRIDGLRALCAAAWDAPEGADPEAVRRALDQLGW